MPERITQEQVDDFYAQQRGFEDAHAERLSWAEDEVKGAEFEVQAAKDDLARAEAHLLDAKKKRRAAKRRS